MKNNITPQTAQRRGTKKTVSVEISERAFKNASGIAEITAMPLTDVISAIMQSTADHVRRDRGLTPPLTIAGDSDILFDLLPEQWGRLEKFVDIAHKERHAVLKMLALAALEALETGIPYQECVVPGTREWRVTFTPPPVSPTLDLPKLRPSHAKKLLVIAELLNVRPQDLLDWHIGPVLDDFYNPSYGSLSDWAENNLVYPDPEERERVVARVNAWNARREKRLARRKSRMESGVAA